MPTQCAGPTLCVGVRASVYWRKASDRRVHILDRKGRGDSRLRLLNADATSFNKLLSSDIAVSPRPRRQNRKKRRGARILRDVQFRRTFRSEPKLEWDKVSRIGFRALHSPPGPHSPIGRGSGLKIRPVSVRVRLGAPRCGGNTRWPRRFQCRMLLRISPLWTHFGHSHGYLIEIGVEQIGVHIQRHSRTGVPEHPLHHLGIGPCTDGQRCCRVA